MTFFSDVSTWRRNFRVEFQLISNDNDAGLYRLDWLQDLEATTSLQILSTEIFRFGRGAFSKAHLRYFKRQWLSISERRWPAPLSPSAAPRTAAAALALSPSAAPHPPAEPERNTNTHTQCEAIQDCKKQHSEINGTNNIVSHWVKSARSQWLPLFFWVWQCPLVSSADWRSAALWPTAPPGGHNRTAIRTRQLNSHKLKD